jgi:hypothetical protein
VALAPDSRLNGAVSRRLPLLLASVLACAVGKGNPGSPDAAPDVMPATDAGGVVFNDMTNVANWVLFDTTMVDPGASGYFGAAFDGRFVYFSPVQGSPIALEYDTQGAFTAAKSWATFMLGDDAGADKSFVGAAYDGRYLYLPPFGQPAPIMSRYDTQGAYTSASSWATVDLASVAPTGGTSFAGAVFAAGHVYLPPYGNSVALSFDTTAPLASSTSWEPFDATSLIGSGFLACSGTFDGRYVYFAPFSSGQVLRFDTSAPFSAGTSWTMFDATTIDPRATAFEGAVFDGQFVYFVPAGAQFTATFTVRYDTHQPFGQTGSWSSFDIKQLNASAGGYVGGAYDGRFVYYVPYGGAKGLSGLVARYDTQGTFTMAAAWQTIDLTTIDPNAQGYAGAAFDGRYLYLSPNLSAGSPAHLAARFDARTPPATPTGYSGSFF